MKSGPAETKPLPCSRDFCKGGKERARESSVRTVWPALWRVLRYGDGLPIEQTRRRKGVAIDKIMAGGIERECAIRTTLLSLLSCAASEDLLEVGFLVFIFGDFGDAAGFGNSFLRRCCVIASTPRLSTLKSLEVFFKKFYSLKVYIS